MLARTTRLMVAALMCVGVASCTEDNDRFSADTGYIHPTVIVDNTIVSPNGSTIAELGIIPPSPEEFALRMTDATGLYSGYWPSIADFNTGSSYRVGTYTFVADTEQNTDAPIYSGTAEAVVANQQTTQVNITASIAQAIVSIEYGQNMYPQTATVDISLHSSSSAAFADYELVSGRPMFLAPGDIDIYCRLTYNALGTVMINPAQITDAKAAHHYIVTLDIDESGREPELVVSINGSETKRVALTPELFNGNSPQVVTNGYSTDSDVNITEGGDPSNSLCATVEGSNLTSILLVTDCYSLAQKGLPDNLDLLKLSEHEEALIDRLGLKWDGRTIDFSELLSNIDYVYGHETSKFSIVARDMAGRVNAPSTLTVITHDAAVNIDGFSDALVGVSEATVSITANKANLDRNLEIETKGADGQWHTARILGITSLSDGHYDIRFELPSMRSDIMARVLYCGKVKGEGVVRRVSPEFTVEADAFARSATLRISCADAEVIPVLTRELRVYNGNAECTVFSRDPHRGIVGIIGLEPSKSYTLKAAVLPPASDVYTASVNLRTEAARDVPNGDFEDTENTLKYADLPSGGRYSQTIVDIFNQQNSASYNLSTPKHWATTNPKTFCRAARNKNTWYMQPSAMSVAEASSGMSALKLVNTAWDLDGPAIPDYTQTSTPYLHYNPNIPAIAHRSAGRAWLGGYSFNPSTGEESYQEGVKFASRPAALNGVYKYLPDAATASGAGLAKVTVWGTIGGKEMVIASGSTLLDVRADFGTFTVPLTYDLFGVKATKICVMLSASSLIGSIDFETASITTVADPVTATSTGATLIIDNLTFAY